MATQSSNRILAFVRSIMDSGYFRVGVDNSLVKVENELYNSYEEETSDTDTHEMKVLYLAGILL